MSTEAVYRDVLIIGAGPAGLSLAYYLEKQGIDYSILEKTEVGSSWKSMPDKLVIISPWWTNLLPGSGTGWNNPFAQVGKNFYHHYLIDYVRKNSIRVEPNTLVKALNFAQNEFKLVTNRGNYRARLVVCATGYFSNPYIPSMPKGKDGSIPELHGSHYFSAGQVARDYPRIKKILLVGKRVTAGQLMVELSRFGFDVAISCRSELTLRTDHSLPGKLKVGAYFVYEALKMRFRPHIKMNSYVDMDGGETGVLLATGKVSKKAAAIGVSEGFVLFADNTRCEYDLIIYATGYRPALGYVDASLLTLNNQAEPVTVDMAAQRTPQLFFIGFDNLVNFRSRYLRGIAKDAKQLAHRIQSRLLESA